MKAWLKRAMPVMLVALGAFMGAILAARQSEKHEKKAQKHSAKQFALQAQGAFDAAAEEREQVDYHRKKAVELKGKAAAHVEEVGNRENATLAAVLHEYHIGVHARTDADSESVD